MADNNNNATRVIHLNDITDLQCQACLEPLSGMLKTCEQGHSHYCCRCFSAECPKCRQAYALRNTTVEELLGSIFTSCKNKNRGCTMVCSYSTCVSHEKGCEFGIKICPMTLDCDYTGTEYDLADHVIMDHIHGLSIHPFVKMDSLSLHISTSNDLIIWETEVEVDTINSSFPLFNEHTKVLLFLLIRQGKAWVCVPRSLPLGFRYTLQSGDEKFKAYGNYYTPMEVPTEALHLPLSLQKVTVKVKIKQSVSV